MKHSKRGYLITLEGIDGSGKTTLAHALMHALEQEEYAVTLTREPGGSMLGARLRPVLQEKKIEHDFIIPKAEFLLFAADRAQHMYEVVRPALAGNMIVISDRMADSSYAYQGYGRGLDLEILKMVNRWVMEEIAPDLTLYIKIDLDTVAKRIMLRGEQLTAFELEKRSFLEKVVEGFDTIFAGRDTVITLDGTLSQDELLAQALKQVKMFLKDAA